MARKSKKMFRSPKLARRQARKRRSQISERRKERVPVERIHNRRVKTNAPLSS